MKKISLLVVFGFLTVLFSISTFAQMPAAKIALINSESFFDEKAGITKLVAANKQLEAEFAVRVKELQDGSTRLKGIAKQLDDMQKLPASQFNQNTHTAKQEEGERLQREITYKKTDLESAVNRRRDILVTPVSRDIGKRIDEFAKKNGYGAIFDVSKFADSGVLLFLAESADATKEFIIFYNTRPATVVPPK
ncbi:MAG: OmpH family outer membrane protein [Pyrinomonadaceae bacterium]